MKHVPSFALLASPLLTSALLASLLLATPLAAAPQETAPPARWPQFRGAGAAGVDDSRPLPETWDGSTGEGVRWKTPVPGLSHSSPIVWGDRVFVVTAVAQEGEASLRIGLYGDGDSADDLVEHTFELWCLDLDDGRPLWVQTAVRGVPRFPRHTKATHADPTPATDGEHVVAMFGAQGMHCYSMDGELRWTVDVGALDVGPHDAMDLHWGFASSPVIADGKVIVQADVKEEPYLAAWDVETGELLWRVARDDTTSWATPSVFGDQIVVNGCKHMGGYALADGREIWRMAGGGGLPIPAPVRAGDLFLLTSNHRPLVASHPQKPMFAVERSATGTLPVPRPGVPQEHVAWAVSRVGLYIQTPLVYRGLVYACQAQGVVGLLDAESGRLIGRRRLGNGQVGFSASAVAGDGKLYFTSEEGRVYVIGAGRDLEVMTTNELGEICMATPAIARGMLLYRTRHHVMAIEGH